MRLEAVAREPRERHPVARRRVDGVDRRDARRRGGRCGSRRRRRRTASPGPPRAPRRAGTSGSRARAARAARGRWRARRRAGGGTRSRRSPRRPRPPAARPRAVAASSSGSVRQSSAPASPLVQHTSQPSEPSAIQRAAVAAGPKSASSGWATITMNRAGRQRVGVFAGGLGHGLGLSESPGGHGPPSGRSSRRLRRHPIAKVRCVRVAPEASLVSPHGRSLSVCPRRGPGHAQTAGSARADSSAARTCAAWPSALTFGQACGDPAVGADEEARADDAPVRLAVVLLLAATRRTRSATAWSSSDRSVNGSPNLARNAAWLPEPSGLMPQTSASRPVEVAVEVAELAGLGGAARACRPAGRSRRRSSGRRRSPRRWTVPCSSGSATSGARSPACGVLMASRIALRRPGRPRGSRRRLDDEQPAARGWSRPRRRRSRTLDRPRAGPAVSGSSRSG